MKTSGRKEKKSGVDIKLTPALYGAQVRSSIARAQFHFLSMKPFIACLSNVALLFLSRLDPGERKGSN